jgi:hypothetical protein
VRRRTFLHHAAGAVTLGPLLGRAEGAPATSPPRPELDAALERLAGTGFEYGGGLANHGPMAAEALVRLGRPQAVMPWVEGYARQLQAAPHGGSAVAQADWRGALGDFRRVAGWAALFERALREASWTDVLQEWAPRLAPGLGGAACHGLIRAGHAARSLAERDDGPRRRELAQGLAYWAARYQALGETPGTSAALAVEKALERVPILPVERRGRGLIADTLAGEATLPGFAAVAGLVDVGASGFLSGLTETFARIYLEQARPGTRIAFIHAVTGPSAVHLLLPHLPPAQGAVLLRYAWQVAAAVYGGYAGAPNPAPTGAPWPREEMIDRAVATGDEHAIKFTEACLREHALRPRPVYLQAAQRNIEVS